MVYENAFYVLLPVLLVITAVAYIMSEYDVMHPFTVVSAVMTISTAVAMLGIPEWNFYIGIDAALLITISVLVFGMASLWTDAVTKNRAAVNNGKNLCVGQYSVDRKYLCLFAVVIIGFTCLQFQETYNMVHKISKSITYSNFMFFARQGMVAGKFKYGRWLSYEMVILLSLSCSCLFVVISNFISFAGQNSVKERILLNIKYLIIPVLCLPAFFLETGRENFLNLLLFTMVTAAVLVQKNYGFSLQSKYTVLRVASFACAAFLILFLCFGFIRSRSGNPDFLRSLIGYIGSPIPELSYFVDTHAFLENQYIGGTTLFGIYSNLKSLGFALPKPVLFLEFSYIHQTFGTNVYTMLRRYIADYGYVGTCLIMAIMGIVYTAAYNYIRFYAKSFWHMIVYGCLVSPLFLAMYDERFLMFIINTTTIYKMTVVYLVCRLFIRREEAPS